MVETGREKAVVLEQRDIERAVQRIAHEIVERNRGAVELAVIGIRTRGSPWPAASSPSSTGWKGWKSPWASWT